MVIITIKLMPSRSLGMVLMSWYGARKYHAGFIVSGVIKGLATIFASGGRNRFGMKVMMKPHVDLIDQGDGTFWRGDIGFHDDREWDKWFKECLL